MADTPEKPRRALAPELSGGALDTLWCLFLNGPTWDGNIPSKAGRSELLQHGYAERRSDLVEVKKLEVVHILTNAIHSF